MTDTIKLKTNTGKQVEVETILGDVNISKDLHEKQDNLFKHTFKSENSSQAIELSDSMYDLWNIAKEKGVNDLDRKWVNIQTRKVYKVISSDKSTGRITKNKSFENAFSRASQLAELRYLGLGNISVELLGKKKVIMIDEKELHTARQKVTLKNDGQEEKSWEPVKDTDRTQITWANVEKYHGKKCRGKTEPNASTSSNPIYKVVELMRAFIDDENGYALKACTNFFNTNFTEKKHNDIESLMDSDNELEELVSEYKVKFATTLNEVEKKANEQTEKEDRKEKERIKKPAKV